MMGDRHYRALCDKLIAQREEGRFTDFLIVPIDGDPIPCHKVVMAAMSPFFETMLSNDMMENLAGKVELPFDRETVELLLRYVYTGENVISQESVTTLYHAAHYLQITSLIEDCKIFLKQGMDEFICLEVWIVSKRFGDQEVAEISRSIVLQGFNALCTVEHMRFVPLEDLKDLFHDPFLNCTGRRKCEAAWIWLVAQEEPDDATVESLLQALVKAVNVDVSDVVEVWSDDVDDCSDDKLDRAQEQWQRACKKLWLKADSGATGTVYDLEECFVIVGSDKAGKTQLIAFDFKKKKWYDLEPQQRDLGHRFAVSSRLSMLYVSGGTPSQKQFLWFHGDTKQWQSLQDMPVGREQHVMCTVADRIYVLGGSSKDTGQLWDVHVYNCANDVWAKCGQLSLPVVAARSVRINDYIFLLGGSDSADGRAPSDTLQYYNIATNISSTLHLRLPFKAKSHTMSATSVGGSIYILHKDEVYLLEPFVRKPREEQHRRLPGLQKVDPKVEKLGPITVEKPPIKGFAVESFGNKVLIFGGEDASYCTRKSVIQYDTESRNAVLLHQGMPWPMKDFHHTKLMVPRTWDVKDLD